jgi:sec-independent protein translocase protein TatA
VTMLAWVPGPLEWAIIGIIALLLFGRRLPEVGKSLGKGIVEFKKGLREVSDEVAKPEEPAPKVDPMAAELAKLKEEIERLKADKSGSSPTNN